MEPGSYRFDRFVLDPGQRQLRLDEQPLELSARYFDALALLVREPGKLISKDRFLDEVWRGVPVTDEALTQCIKTLRKQLGDSASVPRFIETVPKHGYRFIAPVTGAETQTAPAEPAARPVAAGPAPWLRVLLLGAAGTLGGGMAGLLGGLLYGFAGASQPLQPGMGAASVLLVLVCLSIVAGLIGGAGVSFGIAAASLVRGRAWLWSLVGGAAGGLIVGAVAKLLGLDAFNLLFGRSPADMTGAAEGALLGAAVGLGAWLAGSMLAARPLDQRIAVAGVAGGVAGILIPLLGGRLMGGSLEVLARSFPGSRLQLGRIGGLFGENGFGTVTQIATAGVEGVLFGSCLVGAMLLARRSLDQQG